MSIMLEQKIKNHKAKIAVIGLGYVGLPLAVAFAQKGFRVFGIDTSQQRIERIQKKKSYIADVTHRQIARLMHSGHLVVALDFDLMTRGRCGYYLRADTSEAEIHAGYFVYG